MDHDRLKELLPLEALGSLDGEDARVMAAHLAEGCDECQAELGTFRGALAAVGAAAAGGPPYSHPPHAATRPLPRRSRPPASNCSRARSPSNPRADSTNRPA